MSDTEQIIFRPQPEVVNEIRPVLVEAMKESEPGTDNFELAAFLHDQLEEYLAEHNIASAT